MSRLLINESPLQVQPTLACLIGLNEALVLQQIHYWLDPRLNKNLQEGKYWVYNSLKGWHEQFPFFSERTLRRSLEVLEEKQLLLVGTFHKNSWERTKWYTINYDLLDSLEKGEKTLENPHNSTCGQNDHMHMAKLDTCIWPKWPLPSGQNGHIDMANLATSYIDTEITQKTTQKTSIPEGTPQNFEEEGEVHEVYQIWHEIVACKTKLNPERAQQLKTLFKLKFENNLEEWKTFCLSISQTSFLMGKPPQSWRVTLVWILNPENAQKVLDGYYQTAEEKAEQMQKQEKENTAYRLHAFFEKCENEQVKSFFFSLKTMLADQKFISWFEDVSFFTTGNQLHLILPSAFAAEHIRNHFITEMHQAKIVAKLDEVLVVAAPPQKQDFVQKTDQPPQEQNQNIQSHKKALTKQIRKLS